MSYLSLSRTKNFSFSYTFFPSNRTILTSLTSKPFFHNYYQNNSKIRPIQSDVSYVWSVLSHLRNHESDDGILNRRENALLNDDGILNRRENALLNDDGILNRRENDLLNDDEILNRHENDVLNPKNRNHDNAENQKTCHILKT